MVLTGMDSDGLLGVSFGPLSGRRGKLTYLPLSQLFIWRKWGGENRRQRRTAKREGGKSIRLLIEVFLSSLCQMNTTLHNGMESAAEDDSMGDSAGPMFVQHTEAMLDDIDRMKLEIEDVDEEVIDIDSLDMKDPLCVVEYIDDLYTHYRAAEVSVCVPPNYMAQQVHINDRMRGFLVDWLIIEFMKELTKHNIMIASRFKLMEETLYLTVSLIDRLLAVHSVAKKNLRLVGVTAMFIASKYEEVCFLGMDDFIQISEKSPSG
ncbi:cyclin-B2-3-like isoform X2 [Cucurbita moschata]|uniref:B-like cyclin n=1 Tax=Cucurbita moschata TaxID=3662 RepID=A0A6J1FE79_CUCMO|nr:cyclin-B2-3-like isoform X2 [Cucurbita moschata]